MSVWSVFFGWPAGGVWSNLVAAGLWAPIAAGALYVYHRVSRGWHQRERARIAAQQTQELKAHIDQRLGFAAPPEGTP